MTAVRPIGEPRLVFPFTERDTPTLRARISSDLARVTSRLADADPHLRALLLTGGFSRGEGTARAHAPVNDYDLVAVRSRPGGSGRYAALAHDLTREVGLEVDVMPIWDARLPHVGRKLFWLDLRLGGRVIAGDERVLSRLPHFDAREVLPTEPARLLGNRATGMLLALPGPRERADPRQRDLQATKAVLAAMDATLLHGGQYAPRMRERLALTAAHPDHAVFAQAVEWKLRADAPLSPDWWERARDCLLQAVDRTGARWARDGFAEHTLHLVRARRIAASPSQAVRRRAWDLLATSVWPDGPAGVAWGAQKRAFVASRAKTLQ